MHDTLRLGRVAGIPVGVHWSVLGMALLVASVLALGVLPAAFPSYGWASRWGAALAGSVVFGVSLLLHELAHAVVARRHAVGVDGITLWLLGGVARLTRQAPTPSAEFQIAVAGPVVSGVVGAALVAAVIAAGGVEASLAWAVLLWVGLVNLVLAVFNLLPAAPLDGGRVLAALLWRRGGNAERARLHAARAGLVLGVALAIGGIVEVSWGRLGGVATVAIGVFLVGAARTEVASAVVRGRLRQVTMGQLAAFHPPAVPGSMTADRFLAWAQHAGPDVVFPVLRWGHEPIGWVSAQMAHSLGPAERSWVRVEQLMLADRSAPRAWTTEPVDDVVGRLHAERPSAVVVLDPRSGAVVGTVGGAQLSRLYVPPDLWGRDRPVTASGSAQPLRS